MVNKDERGADDVSYGEISKTDTSRTDDDQNGDQSAFSNDFPGVFGKAKKLNGFRGGDRNKEKLRICTDPSEIKPLLTDGSTGGDGEESSKNGENDIFSGANNQYKSNQSTSPTLSDLRTFKSGQYSEMFETACEIEYYTSTKSILSPDLKGSKIGLRLKNKKYSKLHDSIAKCHSATSSPVRAYEEARKKGTFGTIEIDERNKRRDAQYPVENTIVSQVKIEGEGIIKKSSSEDNPTKVKEADEEKGSQKGNISNPEQESLDEISREELTKVENKSCEKITPSTPPDDSSIVQVSQNVERKKEIIETIC